MAETGIVLSVLIVLIFVLAAVIDISKSSGSGLVAHVKAKSKRHPGAVLI